MKIKQISIVVLLFIVVAFIGCKDDDKQVVTPDVIEQSAIEQKFGSRIDLNNLANYSNQTVPAYITKDNTVDNMISDAGATLGRVLFYDKMLSVNNTVACGSCHNQSFAFSDSSAVSAGVNGTTGRHSMRLINARFGDEVKFFWDERAGTLEEQTTMPIQDHAEMGYSGMDGDPSIGDLITKLSEIDYYKELFSFVYGEDEITEQKIQWALAQFVRSIQSFDSKYDNGRAQVNNDGMPFPNFTADENAGKNLFLAPPQFNAGGMRVGGGAGCGGCHRAPEFDIDPNSGNNGVVAKLGGGTDYTVTRSPTLRDLHNPEGRLNGNLMHNAGFGAFAGVLAHYNVIRPVAEGLDNRLRPNGNEQRLMLNMQERTQIEAFIHTLTGMDVYTNEKWANPFE